MNRNEELADTPAIIGMSCRFAPDLDAPDKYWSQLADGRSSVTDMPEKRWQPYAATTPQATAILRRTVRRGSFLKDIEGFDADFFGISPREADFLDPQQRLMLELSWEALERAGIPPLSLCGTDAGVFVAANSNDYGRRLLEDIPRTGAYAVNGTTFYGIANRISYFLDLRGPSLAVDTACAGSLTALHQACQSLRFGETAVAIVGGVNVMATPALNVALDAAGAMSPDGRSKAFDKEADGYGRGEGAGVVVLKSLRDALRDGDPVLALVPGSGVFQDGRSDGMMAPNRDAQEHMLREVYDRAGIAPSTVDYVEAHGTGTPVGDREEAQALARVFGPGRKRDRPCLVGSVKPNIGHVEGGSGIAGVIKTVLALQHMEVPPSIHSEAHPDVAWEACGLRLVGERTPWPTNGSTRRAGVSSYGVGGTIAHLILEEPPARATSTWHAADTADRSARRLSIFPVSAMSAGGLRAQAETIAGWLDDDPDASLASIGYTLSRRRSHLSERAAVVAGSRTELAMRLRDLAHDEPAAGVARARAVAGGSAEVVWVFSGHGAQWSGMGRQLLEEEPAFAEAMDTLEGVFREEMGWTPREAIRGGGPWKAAEVQAMTFAVQVGLAAVWSRYGVLPGAVIGHSVGEIAANYVAGCLELEEAARFACRRARALKHLEGLGGMALIALPFDETQNRLTGRSDVVAAIAASPTSTVVSGDHDAVEQLGAQWAQEGLDVRRVDSDIAFHSSHVERVAHEVENAAKELLPRPAKTTIYSTALAPRSTVSRGSRYWVANLCEPVKFTEAVEAAIEDGHRLFLELSSHPIVAHSITETLDHRGIEDSVVVSSTRRDSDEVETLLGNLARLHCHGGAVDWSQEHPNVDLAAIPTMAWQHRPYWIFAGTGGTGTGGGHDPERHLLLGGRMTISGAPTRQVWQTHLDMSSRPYPQDHLVVGVEITPAASIINTFMAAVPAGSGLRDVALRTPLAVEPPRVVQVVTSENTVRLASRVAEDEGSDEDESEWITHTTATFDPSSTVPKGRIEVTGVEGRCPREWLWADVDEMFRTKGVGGYAFPWGLDELRCNDNEQLAFLTLEAPPAREATSWAHVIDGALTISAVLATPADASKLWMSSHIEAIVYQGDPPARIVVHSRRSARSPHTIDVLVAGEDGQILCEVEGLRFAPLQDQLTAIAAPQDLVHEVVWQEVPLGAERDGDVDHVVLVGDGPLVGPLTEQLDRAGVTCLSVATPEDLRPEWLARPGVVIAAPAGVRDDERPEQSAERCGWTLVRTAQRLVAAEAEIADGTVPTLWCLTDGVRDGSRATALAHAPLWGLSRIVAGEHPSLWGGVVDIDGLDRDTGERLLRLMPHLAGEDVVSMTADETAVARLSPIQRSTGGTAQQCQPSGTYLITGGLGALGLEVAHWLVDRGARRLLLAGRKGLPSREEWDEVRDPGLRRRIEGVLALEALGVTVGVLALDIADTDQVAAALHPSSHGLPPVRGVVHAAGVTRDAMLDKTDRDGLRDVFAPKVGGAMVLHRLFPPGSLDFFVMFSSCGQFARLTGQTTYAAANSFLDALAAYRHADGHTETASLGWTSWRGVGMSETIASTMLEANSRGLGAISATEAFRAWALADRFDMPYKAVLRVLPLPASAPRLPMFRELTALDPDSGDGDAGGGLVDEWASLPEGELRDRVSTDVRAQVAAELNLPEADVALKRPLVELGVDSVMTVALRVRLQRRYNLELPPTILWSKPTVAALGEHVAETVWDLSSDEDGSEDDGEGSSSPEVLTVAAS